MIIDDAWFFFYSRFNFVSSCSRTCQYLASSFLWILNRSFFKISNRGMPVLWKRCFRSDTVGAPTPRRTTDTHNLIHHGTTGEWVLPFCSLRSLAGVQRRMEMRRVARKKPKEAPIKKTNRHSNEPNELRFILSRFIGRKIVGNDCKIFREKKKINTFATSIDYLYYLLFYILSKEILT